MHPCVRVSTQLHRARPHHCRHNTGQAGLYYHSRQTSKQDCIHCNELALAGRRVLLCACAVSGRPATGYAMALTFLSGEVTCQADFVLRLRLQVRLGSSAALVGVVAFGCSAIPLAVVHRGTHSRSGCDAERWPTPEQFQRKANHREPQPSHVGAMGYLPRSGTALPSRRLP